MQCNAIQKYHKSGTDVAFIVWVDIYSDCHRNDTIYSDDPSFRADTWKYCTLLAHINTRYSQQSCIFGTINNKFHTSKNHSTVVNGLVSEPKWKPQQNHHFLLRSSNAYWNDIDHAHQTILLNYVNLNMLICSNQQLNEWWMKFKWNSNEIWMKNGP